MTIRQATGIPGWVGMVDVDLSIYADIELELRHPRANCDCTPLFTVSGGLPDRSLISGPPASAPLDLERAVWSAVEVHRYLFSAAIRRHRT